MSYGIRHIAGIMRQLSSIPGGRSGGTPALDSRRLIFPDSSLFFSLKGPRRDGPLVYEEL